MRILATACVLMMACTPSTNSEKVIVIGSVLSRTGECASGVDEIVEAASLAIKEINDAGGVLGAKLKLESEDDQSTDEGATAATQAVLKRKPVAILGSVCSDQTLKMSELSIAAGVPSISPISTSPRITSLDDGGFVFRTASSDAFQGKLIAKRARARGFTTLAILHDSDAYGEGLRDKITAEFTAAGGTILKSQALPEAVTNASDEWTSLFSSGRPQAVAVITFPGKAGTLLDTFGKSFASGTPVSFYFPDALKQSDFQTQLKAAAPNFTITADNNEVTALGAPNDANYLGFVERFKAAYDGRSPDLGTGSPQAYDAIYLMALGLQAAGSATSEGLRTTLTTTSRGGTAYTAAEFKAAKEAASAGEDIDYVGVTGPCDFDENGDVIGVYDVWRVKPMPRGDFELVAGAVSP